MSGEGWIKLYRQLLDSRVFFDPVLLKVWIWCLLKASRKEQWVSVKTGPGEITVFLKSGQFIFGRHQGSKELSLPPSTLYRKMQCLCVLAMIALKADTHYSVVTILNWEIFQGEWTGKRTPSGHPADTYKNDKNEKKKEYSVDFMTFYKAYPKKSGRDDAWKAWVKRNGDRPQIESIIESIQKQDQWRKSAKSGEFRPEWKNPATWINKGCWADEVLEEKKTAW